MRPNGDRVLCINRRVPCSTVERALDQESENPSSNAKSKGE